MFLMALKGMTLEQAKGFIKERRPIVFQPSANFQRSMEGFQQYLQEQTKKSMNY